MMKTITVKTPYWVTPGSYPATTQVNFLRVKVSKGVKYYYCRPIWSCIYGWHADQA